MVNNETLPDLSIKLNNPLLLESTDISLVLNVKSNNQHSDDSLKILQMRHGPLCHNIYKKYTGIMSSSGHYFQDMVDQNLSVIHKACVSFNEEKGNKFSTWLGNMVTYQCLSTLTNIKSEAPKVSLDDEDAKIYVEQEASYEEDNFGKEIYEFSMNLIKQMSDDRIEIIFSMRYLDNETWDKISEKLKISTQAVINLHEKAIKIIKQKLKSSEHFDRI